MRIEDRLKAIIARIDGSFDDARLMKFGPLGDTIDDVRRIADVDSEACPEPGHDEIVVPVINLNGSNAGDLRDGYIQAYRDLRTAAESLRKAYPHGRDYQTLSPDTYQQARAQHDCRLSDIERIGQELALIFTQIKVPS